MNNLKVRVIGALFIGVMTSECFSAGLLPKKVEGLYPQKSQSVTKVKGSKKQSVKSEIMTFSYHKVFQATKEFVVDQGMVVEKQNKLLGMIIGKGMLPGICESVPCNAVTSFAAYVEIIDDETTKLTIAIDGFGFTDEDGIVLPDKRTIGDTSIDGVTDSIDTHSSDGGVVVSSATVVGRVSVAELKDQSGRGLRGDPRVSRDSATDDVGEVTAKGLKLLVGQLWNSLVEDQWKPTPPNTGAAGPRGTDTPDGVDNYDDLKGTGGDDSKTETLLGDTLSETDTQDKATRAATLKETGRSDSHVTNDGDVDPVSGSSAIHVEEKPKTVVDTLIPPVTGEGNIR